MAGNPFDNPTMSMMYQDALQSLYAGAVMPWERDILSIAPLPADVVDPFASQDVDPLQIMGFTYNSLVTWIDEAKKANYFSKRFTDLSKLVLKGVMTMGRGLITLHNRGEDLTRAPMQIGDLISVGSYHFRKSYLGVIQTAKSHPEISERLLLNQLSWTNMLLRLYKTKEKMAKPVSGVSNQVSGIRDQVSGKQLADGNSDNSLSLLHNPSSDDASSFVPLHSSLDDDVRAFSDVDALFEPAALSAPQALRAMRNAEEKVSGVRDRVSGVRSQVSGVRDSGSGIEDQETKLNEECGIRNAEEKVSGVRSQVSDVRDSGSGIEDQETKLNEECGIRNAEEKEDSEARIEEQGSSDDEDVMTTDHYPVTAESDSSLNDYSSSNGDSSSDNDLPPYLHILRKAFGRSEPNEEGRLTFTFDEIRYLASDPDFARIYPEAAADMRKIQQQIDSG